MLLLTGGIMAGMMKKVMVLAVLLSAWLGAIDAIAATVPTPKIAVAPKSLNLGNVKLGEAAVATVVVSNTGLSDLNIDSIGIAGDNAADFSQSNSCGTIPPAGSCAVDIRYTASLPYAKKAALLTIASNDPKKPLLAIKLMAKVPPPKISVTPAAVNFGKLPSGTGSVEKTLVIKNTGMSNLVIDSMNVSGINADEFTLTGSCNTIETGGNCSLNIVFAPTVVAAKRSASLAINSNDPKKSVVNVKLFGQAPAELPKAMRTLSISKFGAGVIVDDANKLDCGDTCSQAYEEGQTVTLTATPAAGWQIHHWTGCDMINGETCVVAMNSDKSVHPTFTTLATTLHENVVLLDEATMALLKSQAGSTLIFDISASAIAALNPGDVIVSTAGDGLARKVNAVNVLAGSAIYVETDAARLEDIIKDGTVILNQKLSPSALKSAVPLLKGAKLLNNVDAMDASFSISLDSTVGPLTVTGSTTLTIEPDIALSANIFQGITEFKSAVIVKDDTSINLSSASSVPIVDKEVPLYRLVFNPIIVPPAVVLVPVINVKLTVSGEAKAELTAGISFVDQAVIGVHYLKSTGWSPIHEYTKTVSAQEPTFTGELSLKGAVGTEAELLIYGVAGTTASVEGYLQALASETVSASQQCIDWGLYLGVDGSAGAKIEVFGYNLGSYEVPLFDLKWPVLKGGAGSCADTEAPTIPQSLVATPVSSSEIRLAWAASSDDHVVEGYKVQRDNVGVATLSSNSFNDTALEAGKTYCYKVTAYDQSGNESTSSSTVCAVTKTPDVTAPSSPLNLTATSYSTTAVQLTWDAASDDNKVAGYTIYRAGSKVRTTVGEQAIDLGLKPGTTYCYTVQAFDEAGNTSAMSSPSCVTTSTEGAWNIYLACEGQPYVLQNNLDLNEAVSSTIQVTGTGYDYDQITALAYVINGGYDSTSKQLDGNITFSFQNSSCIRVDEFAVNLATGDSGDTVMNQVQACGCTAVIRFVKTVAPLLPESNSPVAISPKGFLSR